MDRICLSKQSLHTYRYYSFYIKQLSKGPFNYNIQFTETFKSKCKNDKNKVLTLSFYIEPYHMEGRNAYQVELTQELNIVFSW